MPTSFIDQLQHKPEPVRKRLFYVLLVLCMLFAASVWFVEVHTILTSLRTPERAVQSASPFTQIKLAALETLEAMSAALRQAD